MVKDYNKIVPTIPGLTEAQELDKNTMFVGSCIVSGFLNDTYNKYPLFTTQIIMEYSPFTPWFASNLPSQLSENDGFIDFVYSELVPW